MPTTQRTPCHICGEEHEPGRGLSFDGMGINSCNIYRTRIATLNSDYRHLGPSMVTAVNSHDRLAHLLRESIPYIEQELTDASSCGEEEQAKEIEKHLIDVNTLLAEIEGR